MNDEQRRVALFQAQPGGLGLFFRPAALSFAHVEQLHVAHSALLDEKIAPAGPIGLVLTGPKAECNLDTQLPAYIKTFAAETDTAVNLKDGAVNKKPRAGC
ncbi:MAG: hypothetical protein AB2687_02285 [Candidatus Thiodiazotropha taylori]